MLTYQVISPKLAEVKPLDEELVCEEIERMAGDFELEAPKRMTLSSKKGSYHWHFKKGKEKGVLEVTYWPKRSELLVEIHDNRRVDWNTALIEPLAADFAEYFGGSVEKG
ncbi:MAG TPA: hypothetical protein VFK33_05965 [Bacillales bacterium]|nr:hypothetical protein [Bacillales bacterium]